MVEEVVPNQSNQPRQSLNNLQTEIVVVENGRTEEAYEVAVMQVLFKSPTGSFANTLEDFVNESLRSLSFLEQEI